MSRIITESAAEPAHLYLYLGGDNHIHISVTLDVARSDGARPQAESCDRLLSDAVTAGVLTAAQATAFTDKAKQLRQWLRSQANLDP